MSADASPADTLKDVLSEILRVSASGATLVALLGTIYDQLGRVMDHSNFYVGLYDPASSLYSFPFSVDQEDDDFTPQELRASLTDYVRRTGEALLCDEATHRALIDRAEVDYVGDYSPIWLGVPLRSAGRVIGVAVVQSYTDPDRFDADDARLMELVFNGVSPSIEATWERENREAARHLELRQLAESRDEALRASAAKSSFLAHMSHELRTPLNAIIGYSELLLEDLEVEGREQGRTELGHIRTSARQLLGMLGDVLDLSRIEQGKVTPNPSDLSLSAVVDDLETLARPLTEAAAVTLSVARGPDQPLHTDGPKLIQVVTALLDNACRFAPGAQVSLRAEPVEGEDGTPWVQFEVADTGPGISPRDLERLFAPFEQADRRTTRAHDGTGLGLTIGRRLARLLGGDLTAASVPGRGSRFQLRVPARLALD